MRPLWTFGCIAIVIHVIAAFHYTHHWSPEDAIDVGVSAAGFVDRTRFRHLQALTEIEPDSPSNGSHLRDSSPHRSTLRSM